MPYVDVTLGERELCRYSNAILNGDYFKGFELRKEHRKMWNLQWKLQNGICVIALVKNQNLVLPENSWCEEPVIGLRYLP